MNYTRQYAPQSSLRIYEPIDREITDGFFSTEHHQSRLDNASPLKKPYQRQESLIDQLQCRQESSRKNINGGEKISNHSIFPKTTSIELMVDQQSKRNATKRQYSNLKEMFASRPQLLSKEISSALLKGVSNPLFQVHQRYSLQESLNNSKSTLQSPVKQISDPQRPNLSRPFLRKKPTSKESSLSSAQNPKKDEALSIQRTRLQTSISSLKEYNSHLMSLFRSMQSFGFSKVKSQEWRSLQPKEIDLLKLMIEKAIISKQVR